MEMMFKTSKGLTSYNEWFISAIKSAKVEGEVQEKKLLQHCLSCCSQVKSLIDSNEAHPLLKYEEFRLNSTILLLLACPTVNSCSQIASSEDLIPLIRSLPEIEDEKLFIVLKGLRNYRYLRGILPWLPASVLTQLLTKFLKQSMSTTPLVLAISFEIIFALSHSLQLEREEVPTLEDSLEAYTTFLKSIEVGFDSEQNCKLRAYHFLYIVESLYLLICLMCKKEIEAGCTVSLGIKIQKLRSNLTKEMPPIFDSVIQEGTHGLLAICSEVVQLITSDIWIAWHDIKSPTFGLSFASGTQRETEDVRKSIQVQVSHTVFGILELLKNLEESENPLNLDSFRDLQTVFKQLALDPDYDPDVDLTNSQLIEAIQDIDSARAKKVLTILLEREDIFELEDCLRCVRQFGGAIPKPIIIPFINRVIDKFVRCDNILDGWKRVVIELCRKLPSENLLHIIKEKLDSGKLDCLRTSEFSSDVTQIFNQLSNHSDTDCYDSFVWLCLQSGVDVVKTSVVMALSQPGLAPVIAPRLRTVHFISRIRDEEGLTLMTRLLNDSMEESLTPENEREFLSLVLKLLEKPQSPDDDEDEEERSDFEMPLDLPEVMEHIILPRLNWKNEPNTAVLLPLEILKSIVEWYPATVLKSEARLSSLIVSLVLIYHNCCTFSQTNVSVNMRIRSSVQFISKKLLQLIQEDEEKYAKEMSIVKVILAQYNLHPRCHNLFILDDAPDGAEASPVDQVFSLIVQKFDARVGDCALPSCSRAEWTWIMYLVLPDCDEEEWTASMRLTSAYLRNSVEGHSDVVMSTLKLYRAILLLLCDSTSRLSKESSSRKFIPLTHCFKCFSSAAMNFVNDGLSEKSGKFSTLITVFRWWCASLSMFDCDPDLPCFFLNALCITFNDLLRAGDVVVRKASIRLRPPSNPSPENTPNQNSSNEEEVNDNGSTACEVVEADINDITHGLDVPNEASEKKLKPLESSLRPNYEVLTRDEFELMMSDLINMFLTSVKQCTMASTIAGKLKSLCELV